MARDKKIVLQSPFMWFDKRIESVVLKEPTGRLYMQLGEPRIFRQTIDGGGWIVENDKAILSYINDLLTFDGKNMIDGGDAVLSVMSLADAMIIKESLFGFFTVARQEISAEKPIG